MKIKWILLGGMLSIMATCSKDDAENEEPVNLRTSGFLCTIGINSIEVTDTLAVRTNNSGTSFGLTDYSSTAEAGGFIVRPRDIFTLVTTGDNNWYLKNNAGKYISFEDDPYAQDDEYSYDIDDAPTEKSVFIRNAEGDKFSLESKYKRGYYLVTRAGDVVPPDPSHEFNRFQRTKQLWFFMP